MGLEARSDLTSSTHHCRAVFSRAPLNSQSPQQCREPQLAPKVWVRYRSYVHELGLTGHFPHIFCSGKRMHYGHGKTPSNQVPDTGENDACPWTVIRGCHEYLQSYQAFDVRLRDFQKMALENWVQEYRGDLGVALTDVVGMDAFLRDFDLYFAKLFDGLRHDSGDPIEWGEKALAHYVRLRIDAHTKRLTFSDGLDLERAFDIWRHFADRTQLGFGIGTTLTNDVGLVPLNIVMKLTQCNGQPVAKLSDSPGKTLCKDETFLAYLRQVFNVAPEAV